MRPQRLAKILIRGLVYTVALLLIVVALGLAALETGWAKNQLRGLIVRQANQYLTATLEIGRLEGSLLRGIRLGDIRLSRGGETLVSVDDVALTYSLRELFERGVIIRRIRLVGPRIVAAREPDGRWNLAALVRRDTRQNQQSGPGRPIHILTIELSDAVVTLKDPLVFGAAHVPSHFDDFDAVLSFDYEPVTWRLNFTRASWKGTDPDLTVNSLSGVIGNGSDGWVFEQLVVDTPRSHFTLDGRVDRRVTPTRINLDVVAERFAFQEWSGILRGLRNIAIEARFQTRLQGPLAALGTDINLESNGGGVRGALTLNTTVPGWHATGTANVQRLDLARWLNRPDRPSDISGGVTFDIDLQLGAHFPVGTYAFDGAHAGFMDYEADDVKARGNITAAEVHVAAATATAYGANVRLASGSIGIDSPYPFRFAGTVNGIDLRQVPRAVPVPHVDSVLTFDYDVSGRFVEPFIAGAARFGQSQFLGATVAAGATGAIDTSVQPFTYSGEGDLTGIDLQRFGVGLDVGWLQEPRYEGRVAGRFHVTGAGSGLAMMTLNGGGRLTRADLFGGTLSDADVTIDIANGSLTGSYDGRLRNIDPAIPLADPRFQASLTGSGRARMAVRDLLVRTPTLGDYTIDGALALTQSTLRELNVDRAEITAALASSTLSVMQLRVQGPAVDLHANGTVEFDGRRSSRLNYEITRGDLGLLTAGRSQAVKGQITTTGQLTGPTGTLHLTGDGTVTRADVSGVGALTTTGRYDVTIPSDAPARARAQVDGRASFVQVFGQQIQQASGTVTYDDGHVTMDVALQQREGLSGAIAGSFLLHAADRAVDFSTLTLTIRRAVWRLVRDRAARIAWDDHGIAVQSLSFTDAETGTQQIALDGTWKTDGSGALHVTAKQVFLDSFAVERPARYGGVLTLDATLRGTRARPIVTGTVAIAEGRIRRLSYQRLAGRIDYAADVFKIDLRLDQGPGVWLTVAGDVPIDMLDRVSGERPMDVAVASSAISLGLIEGVTDVVRTVTGQVQLNVRVVGTSRDPHFDGTVALTNAGFLVASSGARYKNGRADIGLAPDRVTVNELHLEDNSGHPLDVHGSLGTHELKVGDVAIDVTARAFEVIRNEFGQAEVDAALTLRGQFESPRVAGRVTVTGGQMNVDTILDRTLFQPYATQAEAAPSDDAIVALNPWDRLGMEIELHVPNTLKLVGENVQITPGTPLGLGNINLRLLGDLFLYKDPAQPLYVTGSFDSVTGTYTFQGRRFDLDPVSSINFRGDLNPELYVSVTREISGVATRVTIAGPFREPELRLASTPPLDPSDILSLIVFNTTTNELSALQQQQLAVRAGTLAAGFLATPMLSAIERSLGLDTLEIEPGADSRGGARVTVGDEIAPGLVARFSRQFGVDEYDEATIEYYLSRILRIRATFSDATSLVRSPFRRVERAGIDLLLFFSF